MYFKLWLLSYMREPTRFRVSVCLRIQRYYLCQIGPHFLYTQKLLLRPRKALRGRPFQHRRLVGGTVVQPYRSCDCCPARVLRSNRKRWRGLAVVRSFVPKAKTYVPSPHYTKNERKKNKTKNITYFPSSYNS